MRQLHILFNSAKTWHVIVCWFLCFPLILPELNLKLFWTSEQNNFKFSSGKFGGKHRNHQTITCQVLNRIWNCLIFITYVDRNVQVNFKCNFCSWHHYEKFLSNSVDLMKHLRSVLKLIESNGEGENEILDNLENLKNTIDSFEEMLEDTEFNQDPERNLQLHDFVNKLKMIKGNYRIHKTWSYQNSGAIERTNLIFWFKRCRSRILKMLNLKFLYDWSKKIASKNKMWPEKTSTIYK